MPARKQGPADYISIWGRRQIILIWPSAEKIGAKITPIEYTLTGSNRRSFLDVVFTHFRPEGELGEPLILLPSVPHKVPVRLESRV